MTSKEAFKFGFLLRCAEEGLAPLEIEQRMQKAASVGAGAGLAAAGIASGAGDMAGDAIRSVGSAGTNALGTVLNSAKWLAFGGPPAAGLFGGYMLSQMNNDTHDLEELRKQEELEEYYRAIDHLSRPRPVASSA